MKAVVGSNQKKKHSVTSEKYGPQHKGDGNLDQGPSSQPTLPRETQEGIIRCLRGKASRVRGNKDMTSIMDFAGHQVYYNTHPIFMTREAVYLILFNLTGRMHNQSGKCRVSRMASNDITDMSNAQTIKYWMRLIYTYAIPAAESQQKGNQSFKKPQIAVVGTHYEDLPGTPEEKDKLVEELGEILFQVIKGEPYEGHVLRKIYAVDNKSSSVTITIMLNELKQDVGGFLKALKQTIPLKWLELKHLLLEMTAVKTSYDEICRVATGCGIATKNLIHALHYFHDIGVILYFEYNEVLKHSIITNPPKLINMFKRIVTCVKFDDKLPVMIELWHKLDNEGILEEELARHLWKEELEKDESNFEVFVALMAQFGLLCEQIKEDQESGLRSFFVPCRLKHNEKGMVIEPVTDEKVSIYITSEDFIPDNIFHPLVVRMIGWIQDKGCKASPELFQNKATIGFGLEHNLSLGQVVINNRCSLKLEISCPPEIMEDGTKITPGEPSPQVCNEVLEFLKQQLKLLTSQMKHCGYEFRVLCWNVGQAVHFHNLEECLRNKCIRCGEELLYTGKLRRIFDRKPTTVTQPRTTQAVEVPSTSQWTSSTKVLTTENYRQLLLDVTKWWTKHGDVFMLKVLLSDFKEITVIQIQNENKAYNLFQLLHGSGRISPSNVDVLIEATALAQLTGIEDKINKQFPTFPGFTQTVFREFSEHRQNLIEFGRNIVSNGNIETIGYLYGLDGMTNPWQLIYELERSNVLTVDAMDKFFNKLEENEMKVEAAIL